MYLLLFCRKGQDSLTKVTQNGIINQTLDCRSRGSRKGRSILDESLVYEILSVVEEIPEGKVASYGQIARLIGREKNARLVGKVLSRAEFYGKYPCHRVVNHAGRLAPHFREQKRLLLLEEGVAFKANGYVNMNTCQWDCFA